MSDFLDTTIKTPRTICNSVVVSSPFADHPTNRLTQEMGCQLASTGRGGRQESIFPAESQFTEHGWSTVQLMITPSFFHSIYASYRELLKSGKAFFQPHSLHIPRHKAAQLFLNTGTSTSMKDKGFSNPEMELGPSQGAHLLGECSNH